MLFCRIMKFHEFKTLSPDEKNNEILRCLPLLTPLSEEFAGLKSSLRVAVDRIGGLETEYGVLGGKVTEKSDC